jgi:hypothetical protein
MTPEPRFKTDDVHAVALALLADAVNHEDGDYFIGYVCRHCGHKMATPYKKGLMQNADPERLEHSPSCPVLVARGME